jgi:hypothetical protein
MSFSGRGLAYVYARDIKAQADPAKGLTVDEARRTSADEARRTSADIAKARDERAVASPKKGTASHLVEGWREAVPTHRSVERSHSILTLLTNLTLLTKR